MRWVLCGKLVWHSRTLMKKKLQRERFSRPPVRRMIRIHDAIQSGRYPNCAEMAVEMEVSHKTAKRDVEFMRDRVPV